MLIKKKSFFSSFITSIVIIFTKNDCNLEFNQQLVTIIV